MKTQIFATFGPACGSKDILKRMIEAGMTGMRLNLSHTTLPKSVDYINAYKEAAKETGVESQILIDMQGPELRVGEVGEGVVLEVNQEVQFVAKENIGDLQSSLGANAMNVNEADEAEIAQIRIPQAVMEATEIGDEILLDDGKILVKATAKENGNVIAKVIRGGKLLSHKSVKIKDKYIKLPPLTAHDIENIKLAREYGVTALMQPFVLDGEELRQVRDVLRENNAEHVKIFAKIENKLGVKSIESILPEADVIIIARGDLGNDMPLWELPRVQKQLESACKAKKVPYVVVTQMLSSMESNPVPTRAEVSDIFHAVFHGAYGIMITGESAIGKYPVEAVKYLTNTAREALKNEAIY